MATNGLRFKDKVAIVTGRCKGIGKGCVDVFVENGGKVVVFDIDGEYSGTGKPGKGLAGKYGSGEMHFIYCDTTKEEQIKAAVSETVEKYGKIDCLVNNAGWHPPLKTTDEETAEEFNKLFQLNVTGYFTCCKYALPQLRKTKGSIINISSTAKNGERTKIAYAATKGAVSSMTYALALDEGQHGVRVNALCPGDTLTPLFKSVIGDSWKDLDETSLNVLGRIGDPREIGQACLFLAVEATYTTGTDLWCSGAGERGGRI